MSTTSRSSKIPNTEKLFTYLQKEQWQNVSANFSGFVRKEFDSTMRLLEEDEENFKHLRMVIEYAEVGRYSDAKAILDPAHKEFQELEALMRNKDIFKTKVSPRRQGGNTNAYDDRRQTYSPAKQASPTQRNMNDGMNYGKGRDIYSPNKRESLPGTPKRPGSEGYGEKRDLYSPGKRGMVATPKREGLTPNVGARQDGYTPRHYHEVSERSPHPRTPQKGSNQPSAYDDPHRLNYDSLRLKSPDKGKGENSRLHTPNERMNSGKSDQRSHGSATGFDQLASSKEVWGRDDNKPRMGYSTYRQEFPEHPVESYERQDKNRYRENFGSATENEYMQHQDGHLDYRDEFRETILVGQDVKIQIESKSERLHRLQETPDNDMRPTDLARRFKEIYMNEWTDAYDEIVKEFGAEKTVRHLLWIVTEAYHIATEIADNQLRDLEQRSYSVMAGPPEEAYLIATEIADNQLRDLEQRSYRVMAGPPEEAYLIATEIADNQLRDLEQRSYRVMAGPPEEAWLIALDIGDKQLRDLEKSTYTIMSRPGSEHLQKSVHSRDLGESLPTSRNLLLKYRKQTSALSVPYVKEECRDKICRTLLESCGFSKIYLNDASRIVAYIHKCAEVVWLMSVQDPPIVLEYITRDTEGARFNAEHYQSYTSPGGIYKFGVWPLLRLDRRGPIIAKGIAQGVQ